MILLPLVIASITATQPMVEVTGDWTVRVPAQTARIGKNTVHIGTSVDFLVKPPTVANIHNRKFDSLPILNPNDRWMAGVSCCNEDGSEVSIPGILKPESLKVKHGPYGKPYEAGKDYDMAFPWPNLGRLDGGAIGPDTPVWVDYTFTMSRIDTIAVDKNGVPKLIQGKDAIFCAQVPPVVKGEVRLANIYVANGITKLSNDLIYPIRETQSYHDTSSAQKVRSRIPKTWQKLNSGGSVRILAWGDSVTEAVYVPDKSDRWQEQFIARLREKYPSAKIELITQGWGGRTTAAYLAEPPGSPRNFKEQVLDMHPDLVISEFINDTGIGPEVNTANYDTIRDAFKERSIEWIIMTPHYDTWAHLGSFSDRVEKDTRPYIAWSKSYTEQNGIALVDGSARWDHLAAQGIPYATYLHNSINHPLPIGLKLYADALMDVL